MKNSLDSVWSLDGDWSESADGSTRRVPGDFEYGPESGIQLKLKGVLDTQAPDLTKQPRYPRLFGRAPGVGDVTLMDAFTNGRSTGTVDRSDLIASTAVLGLHLPAETPMFDSSSASLGLLEEWLTWRPIEVDYTPDNPSVSTKPPAPLRATVPELACELVIEPTFGSESAEGWNRIGLIHTARIRLKPNADQARDLKWHLETLAALRDLVTLFAGAPSWFRTIGVECDEESGSVVGPQITTRREHQVSHQMMLSWPNIGLEFEPLIKAWFEHRARLEPSHHLLARASYESMPHSDVAFLSVAQAIDSYATRCKTGSAEGKISLKDGFDYLVEKFPSSIRPVLVKDAATFIERAVATRNWLTHHNEKKRSSAYHRLDVYHAKERLRTLLTLAFLLDLGVTPTTVSEVILSSWRFKHRLEWQG